ncbi:MAG: phosphoribosylformylglycinamidine synthase subunit PurS [Ignavibacteriales bacterium]
MYKATIIIKRRKSILDPQGKAVEQGAKLLKLHNVSDVRIGKFIELNVDTMNKDEAQVEVDKLCNKLLANLNIEEYEFTLEEV